MIVPRAQCLLKISTLKFNIVCQNTKYELPQSLAHFKSDGSIPDQLSLTTLVLDSSTVCLMSWPHDTKVEFDTRARLEVVDLATLTVMHIVNSFVLEGRIFRTNRDEHSLLDISLLVHPIMVKFGPAAGHSILTAMQLWKDSNKPTQIIPARYVVCNDTAKIIIFRQVCTQIISVMPLLNLFCGFSTMLLRKLFSVVVSVIFTRGDRRPKKLTCKLNWR